ncbi:MAG: hypothetical protein EOM90_01840 [Alphaproteobacteria bacterium]|nr:hypothetical protein [Alphaproteobacteria bacterium]
MTKPEKEIRDIKKHLQGINDNIEKILYLERWKTDREQSNLLSSGFIDVMSGVDQVLQWVLLELTHLKSLPKQDPKDDPWYESYFNVTYLDFEDIWNSDEYHVDNINLDKKYDITDPKMIIKPHTQEEFEEYDKLMVEMKELVREEISQRLQSNISGTIKFLEHHLAKYEGASIVALCDPNELKSKNFRENFEANHPNSKLVIGDPENMNNPDFMEFYNEHRHAKNVDKKPFLLFIKEILPGFPEISEMRKNTILEWVEEKMKDIKNNVTQSPTKEKIKWLGSPAVLAFLMQEFVAHNYIQPPNYGSEATMTGLAKLCYEYFDIKAKPEYFERAMRNPDALSNAKKLKFTIPDSSEIA